MVDPVTDVLEYHVKLLAKEIAKTCDEISDHQHAAAELVEQRALLQTQKDALEAHIQSLPVNA